MGLHFFTANGKETTEGASDSVVQYDEATATRLGLKFKASNDPAPEPFDRAAAMKVASLDGSEKPEKVEVPVVEAPEPVEVATVSEAAKPTRKRSK